MRAYIIGYHAKNSDHCHERLVWAESEQQAREKFAQLRFGRYRSQDIVIDHIWEEL